MSDLKLPAGKKIKHPVREPDMYSKRGIPYWFGPEWVRSQNGYVSRIKPVKKDGDVKLHTVSKVGVVTYIQGSIQEEFQAWHEDRQIDYILLGIDEDELCATEWDYE
jgi:hypothetical protein